MIQSFEEALHQEAKRLAPEGILREAMAYSLLAGGKRMRPMLYLSLREDLGNRDELDFRFAACIEMIHTYSLIHDDLPAMDNDDLRRGKPTNHVVYGEAMAILAGDGLLSRALEISYELAQKDPAFVTLGVELSRAAGSFGMVYGQSLDMDNQSANVEEVRRMIDHKTGCLIALPIRAAVIRSGIVDPLRKEFFDLADLLGFAFQLQDDILDVESSPEIMGKSIGKDQEQDKVNLVHLLGLERAHGQMKQLKDDILGKLELLSGHFHLKAFDEEIRRLLNRKY